MEGIAVARDIPKVRDQCLMMTSDQLRQPRCLQLLEELAMQALHNLACIAGGAVV